MVRGEIRWVDLDPARGGESNRRRPCIIVSNDGANATASRLGRGDGERIGIVAGERLAGLDEALRIHLNL